MDTTQNIVDMNIIILKIIQKLVCVSYSKVGAYDSHKSNSDLGQKNSMVPNSSGYQSPQFKV